MISKTFVLNESKTLYSYCSNATKKEADIIICVTKREYDKLNDLYKHLKSSIEHNDYDYLNDKINYALKHKYLCPKLKQEVEKVYNRLKKEREIIQYINNLDINPDYRKIKQHIKWIEDKMVDSNKNDITLSDDTINHARAMQMKLQAERNLRFYTKELKSKPITNKVLDEYKK